MSLGLKNENPVLIGLVGFQGCGKTSVGNILKYNYGFEIFSFASALKDCCSTIFCWKRDLLEGDTIESRLWREQPDIWWSEKLGVKNFTPRYALQHIGTSVMREQFNDNIWLLSIQRKIIEAKNNHKSIVITDCRFRNEIEFIMRLGGVLINVHRPDSFKEWMTPIYNHLMLMPLTEEVLIKYCEGVHRSEWEWLFYHSDCLVLMNSGSLKDLEKKTIGLIKSLLYESLL